MIAPGMKHPKLDLERHFNVRPAIEPGPEALQADAFVPMPAAMPTDADEAVQRVNQSALLTQLGTQVAVLARWEDTRDGQPIAAWKRYSEGEFFTWLQQFTVKNADGESVGLGRYWRKNAERPQFMLGAKFVPDETLPAGWFNTWTGFAVTPTKGDVQPILDHIGILCGHRIGEVRELLDRLAYFVQHPGKLGEVAIVLQGPKGTGKGALAGLMLRIFGTHGLHIHQRDQLTGKFNGHLEDVAFLVADEAFFVGDKAAVNALKGQITDPVQMIERKGKDAYQAENLKSVMILTNEQHVVDATGDERRFFVIKVPGDHAQDPNYFGPLFEWIDGPGPGRFLHYLLARDLSGFVPQQTVRTDALREQIEASLDPLDALFVSWMRDGLFPQRDDYQEAPTSGASLQLKEWADDNPPSVTTTALQSYVEDAIGRKVHKGYQFPTKVGELVKGTLGASRRRGSIDGSRQWSYDVPALSDAREAWARHQRGTVAEWFGEDEA